MSPDMSLESRDELANLNKRKEVYETAKTQLQETIEMIRKELHDTHELSSIARAIRDLELLILGCSAKITRLETIRR